MERAVGRHDLLQIEANGHWRLRGFRVEQHGGARVLDVSETEICFVRGELIGGEQFVDECKVGDGGVVRLSDFVAVERRLCRGLPLAGVVRSWETDLAEKEDVRGTVVEKLFDAGDVGVVAKTG